MRGRRGAAAAVLWLGVIALAPAAHAGTVYGWEQLTTGGSTLEEPVVLRTADGTLHAVTSIISGAGAGSLLHRAIAPDGVLGSVSTITSDWATIDNPALVPTADGGLRVLFGGIRTTASNEPNAGISTATADASGSAWSLQIGAIVGGLSYASGVAAVALPDAARTPLLTWYNPSLFVHVGLATGAADPRYQTSCCTYYSNVAVDAESGAVFLAWYSNASATGNAVLAQAVEPTTGAPIGGPFRAPYATQAALPVSQRLALTSRPGRPGVFLMYEGGYPSTTHLHVWRVGDPAPTTIAESAEGLGANSNYHAIAAGPDGRLWVVWFQNDQLWVRRSNPEATAWSDAVAFDPPAGTSSVWHVAADAQANVLDVVVHATVNGSQGSWHIQALPGLTIDANRETLSRAGGKVVFTVSDAGSAIAGATVSAGKKSRKTRPDGTAKLGVPGGKRGTRRTITASYPGYALTSLTMTVGRPKPTGR